MATGSEVSWAIQLPNQFEPFGNILQKGINAQGNQNELLYNNMLRQQRQQEQDEWKKLNLIQDLTDISKLQTGSDVANAIGNSQVSKIFQKYTQEASKLSPAQLQASLSKDMSGLINSMQGVKTELETADEQLKALKQNFPDLDMSRLAKDSRADILNRRLKSDTEFFNPLEVKPSEINLGDPEHLSRYATGNKNLISSIVEPKGAEAETVLMGKQGDYTKFEGKLPFWKTPTYDRGKFNPEGFYTGREIPSFKVKSSVIPTDAIPSSKGKPFEVVEKDVYERFAQDGKANLELISATRKMFPDYDKFNSTEKEYAKRNVLLNQLKSYDQSQLHPTSNVRPVVNRTNINVGGKSSDNTSVLDVYKEIDSKISSQSKDQIPFGVGAAAGTTGTTSDIKLNQLTPKAQQIVLNYANGLAGNLEPDPNDPDKLKKIKFYQEDIKLVKDNRDGQIYMLDAKTGDRIAPIDFTNVNLPAQSSVKEKRKVVEMGGKTPAQRPTKDPLGLF
jgi:hypothetical protein